PLAGLTLSPPESANRVYQDASRVQAAGTRMARMQRGGPWYRGQRRLQSLMRPTLSENRSPLSLRPTANGVGARSSRPSPAAAARTSAPRVRRYPRVPFDTRK